MKHSWMILGLLLCIIAGVGVLIYLLVQGLTTSIPWLLLIWLLVFGILAAVGGIAWLAGWLPRKKKS
jgi:uncharacterized BrkB/YihY/UPF0761 family membrane protein